MALVAALLGASALERGMVGGAMERRSVTRRALRLVAQLDEDEPSEEAPISWRTEPPKGVPEAALADRRGPFWTSLGEPDENTGPRPNFLRRNDWHISSVRTDEETEEEEEKIALLDSEDDITQYASGEDDDPDARDPLKRSKYMQVEPEVVPEDRERRTSKYPMPKTWQEYQHLQSELGQLSSQSSLSSKERKEADDLLRRMEEGYLQFKRILAEG